MGDIKDICSNKNCINSRCIKYSNNQESMSFCHCYQRWSGKYCTIQYNCIWGSLCLLSNNVCQLNENSTCYNGGQYPPVDEYLVSDKEFICICPKGYSGEQCKIVDNKIILSFHTDIIMPHSIISGVPGIMSLPVFLRFPVYYHCK
ncbi:unnamed protein product [Rotaria sp. Silwood2]|nr:unnamed protein product [Rotaria sp. Silwood2]CAF4536240.1 unnamed protein product [Rotaria sp. Silwood2]